MGIKVLHTRNRRERGCGRETRKMEIGFERSRFEGNEGNDEGLVVYCVDKLG